MPKNSPKIRPPIKWHGGKYYLAKRIVALLPNHHTYVEPFGGAASVLLNKPLSPVEVYNDLDGGVVNFFEVCRDWPDILKMALKLTPYAEAEFEKCKCAPWLKSTVEQARRFYVRCRQSIGGQGRGFSYTKHRSRSGMADVVSAWISSVDTNLPMVIDRFSRVQILKRSARRVIRDYDSPTTCFYCDPPYLPETRVKLDVYNREMTRRQHVALLRTLRECRSHVIISGYPSKLYDQILEGWSRTVIDMPNNAAKSKTKRRMEEVIWTNFQ
jgi:DNA adenine methylase